MSLFKSSNPILSEKKLTSTVVPHSEFANTMTVSGTIQKFGFLFLMLMGAAYYSWKEQAEGGNAMPLIMTGAIGGLVVALIIVFKKEWAPFLAPLHALLQGLFIGAISAAFHGAFAETAPNIIFNAVGLTLAVCAAMYFLYTFRIIKVTEKLRSIVIAATAGIAIFYLMVFAMRMFGFEGMSFLHEGSPIGIGFSLLVVGLAALNLLLDFDMIEKGTEMGAPKFMEWFCAFGLMITIVWLYIEILRLLGKISGRD